MYIDLWIVRLFFITASVQACTKFHAGEEMSGEGKLDCIPNGCALAISPNPTKVTLLTINSFGTKTDVYFTSGDSNQKTYWEKASAAMDDRSYSVGPHVGFHLISKNDNCSAEPRYSFQRVSPDNRVCGSSLNYIGNDVQTIQQGKENLQAEKKCYYHLLPMNPSESETLYMLSDADTSFEVTYKDSDHTEKSTSGQIIALKKWDVADFLKSYQIVQQHWYYPPSESIQAVTTKRTCSCKNKNIKLGSEQLIEFQSPGYPDFLCPSSECKHLVKFLKPNLTDDYVQRVLVTINANSGDQVTLELKSKNLSIELSRQTFKTLSTSFLLDWTDIEINYRTPKSLFVGPDGHFKISLKTVNLRKECDCSVFNSTAYNSDQTFQIHVPSHCETIFCSWTVTPHESKFRVIELKLENGQIGDEVRVWNQAIMENYNSHQMSFPRKLFELTYTQNTYISFWRENAGPNATLFVSWRLVNKTGCINFENVTLTTTPRALTSSNYPMFYTHSENCKTLLTAPKNHFIVVNITDCDLQYFHDHLFFYDGSFINSTLLRRLDGKQDEFSITSTGNNMLVHFMSDGYHAKRGFHYVAYAVPLPSDEPLHDFVNILEDLVEQSRQEDLISGSVAHQYNSTSNYTNVTELNSTSPQNSELQQGHGTLFLFSGIFITAIVLIILVIGVLFIKKRIGNSNRQDSFVNSMVTFRSDDNDSIATDGV
ncbi:unnamed protein product [Caenorhabditis brenneri]